MLVARAKAARATSTRRGRGEATETMSSKRNKKRKKKRQAALEHASDERTAKFLAGRLGQIQEDLGDLMADLRTFDHYEQVVDVGLCMYALQRVKRKYEKFADKGAWDDDR